MDSAFQRLNNRGKWDTLSNQDVILTGLSLKTIILMGGTYPLRPNNEATPSPLRKNCVISHAMTFFGTEG